MNRRYLSVRLPFFPVERHLIRKKQDRLTHIKPWWDAQPEPKAQAIHAPLVLVEETARGTRLSALSHEAQALGLWVDMKLSDARAMIPDLEVQHHDRAADETALHSLADWLHRYSPTIAIYDANTILLDTQGCDHLFGGEKKMLDDLYNRLSTMTLTCRLGLANSVGAAIAITTHGAQDILRLERDHDKTVFDTLPVETLRLDEETVIILKRLGLKLIGDLRHIPRNAIERRFGKHRIPKSKSAVAIKSLSLRVDQLYGEIHEPLIPLQPQSEFRTRLPCIEPALEIEAVKTALKKSLAQLCDMLERQCAGARGFRFCGYLVDGNAFSKEVFLSRPLRKSETIERLFQHHLEDVDCGFGIDLFTLEARFAETITPKQDAIIKRAFHAGEGDSILDFADTLANRLECTSAWRLDPRQSHVPERAQSFVLANHKTDWQTYAAEKPVQSPRPMRLFERPEPAQVTAELPDSPPVQFIWRKRLRKIIRSRGPERILPEWWKDDFKSKRAALLRDYYDVEDNEGVRYWIYRTVQEQQAIVDNDASDGYNDDPVLITNWYVHGLF